jgi:hypothetical protein
VKILLEHGAKVNSTDDTVCIRRLCHGWYSWMQ